MISPDPSAIFRHLENGGVILNVESGAYFQVNASGRFIWETLEGGVDRNDLIEAMATNFDISSDRAAPSQSRCSRVSAVTSVSANTNTRSKNSSTNVALCPSGPVNGGPSRRRAVATTLLMGLPPS